MVRTYSAVTLLCAGRAASEDGWAVADDLAAMDGVVADLSALFAKWHSFLLRQMKTNCRVSNPFNVEESLDQFTGSSFSLTAVIHGIFSNWPDPTGHYAQATRVYTKTCRCRRYSNCFMIAIFSAVWIVGCAGKHGHFLNEFAKTQMFSVYCEAYQPADPPVGEVSDGPPAAIE